MKKVILLLFVFSISLNLTAQKRVNLDTFNIEQLNVHLDKAVTLRNAGLITAVTGMGIAALGYISSFVWWLYFWHPEDWVMYGPYIYPSLIGLIVGIPTTLVGLIEASIGYAKKVNVEIAIKKFNVVPENSMALGLGMAFRF